MAQYIRPIPGATVGRTDQGVDTSAPAGTPILAITRERVMGIISNWYAGQPYVWFQQLNAKGKATGVYNYVAEQITNLPRVGQVFKQGQQVATVAASGTGQESGFATASGATLARATTGYTEGEATAAGSRYRQQVFNAGAAVKAGPSTVNVPGYVPKAYVSWVRSAAQGTGLPASVVAAQINDESGFDPNAKSGAGAEGIAQFLPGTFKSYAKGSPYNPADAQKAYINYMNSLLRSYHGNIRNALAAYNAGPGNLAAGYGYADAILSKAGIPQSATAGAKSTYGGTRPGGQPASGNGSDTGQSVDDLFSAYETELNTPRTAPPDQIKGATGPFNWWLASFTNNWESE